MKTNAPSQRRFLRPLIAAALITGCSSAVMTGNGTTSTPAVPTANLPLKYTARPTSPTITPADLMSRLYVFADDSMLGRQVGFEANLKGTQYIAD
ncbi:MAG TPA: hypothetical protein VFC35_09750 [Gemmatimonadaceae bacterium]|nr:hypothetical protein [Gemmatimonadaceae bacterium]